ncbi:3-deoxy-manno-octulosonate cytidylyltransferase [Gorillibacterium sp. CAU 1737]|uniref:3-deoxy-manno-octulosonate cytidylyltransferase n=1 Tax=Gorillibacterium sp. CAU 1737 TaxID=3140362 RepID=UPI00325FFB9B
MAHLIGVIPARYLSTRLPGKPLADICGKPMIWWVYERVKHVQGVDQFYVATDDDRIAEICSGYSIPYIMTGSHHQTAANRLWEVSEKIPADFYIQVNGDEPLINCWTIEAALPEHIISDREFGTNLYTPITQPSEVIDPSNIKMVMDHQGNALYMSRSPIPFPFKTLEYAYFKHVGVIGYNKKMLDFYESSVPGKLEQIEGIDTLRFLDYGKQLVCKKIAGYHSLSVDTPKDLEIVRTIIAENIRLGGAHNDD